MPSCQIVWGKLAILVSDTQPVINMNTDDKPHEECGVVGAFIPGESVARTVFFALS